MFDKDDIDLIATVIGMVTTIITALAGQAILGRKRIQEKLDIAQADIAYLLAVEAAHCEKHKELSRTSFKLRIRNVNQRRKLSTFQRPIFSTFEGR